MVKENKGVISWRNFIVVQFFNQRHSQHHERRMKSNDEQQEVIIERITIVLSHEWNILVSTFRFSFIDGWLIECFEKYLF